MGGGMWKSCLSVSLSTADTRAASLPAAVIWKLCFRSASCPLRLSFSHPFKTCLIFFGIVCLFSFAMSWWALVCTYFNVTFNDPWRMNEHTYPSWARVQTSSRTSYHNLVRTTQMRKPGWCKVFLWSLASGVYQSHLGVLKLQLPVLTHSVSHGVCTLIILSLIFMWCPCRGRILGWGNCPSPWRVNVSILRSEALSHWFWGTRREWMEALVRFLIHVSLDLELRIFFPKPPCCCPWICLS